VHVPEALLDRMRRAEAAGDAQAEGLAIAREIAAALRGVVEGLQITTGTATGNPLPAVLGVLEVCTP
jgi:hypothetical protein